MTDRRRIWLTRPQADSEALAATLHTHGVESVIFPVLSIQPTTITISQNDHKPTALLLTSRHAGQAVALLPAEWRSLPTYCVGDATAEVARAAGYSNVIAGEGDVFALLPLMTQTLAPGSHVLYLAGDTTRTDIGTLLGARDIRVEERVAYQAQAEKKLSAELRNKLANHRISGVAFFSPRSATIAGRLIAQYGLNASLSESDAYCMSLNVATAAATIGFARVHTCHTPTADAMRDLIVSLNHQKML